MRHRAAHDVRDRIIDRLSSGAYALGSQLPPARELALEIGVHRNTVAKAYRDLAELGLVSLKQGRGTYVVALVEANGRPGVVDQVRRAATALAGKARRLGVGEEELRGLIDEQIAAVYHPNPPRAAFVECNREDLVAAIGEIETMAGVRLAPLLLDDLRTAGADAVAAFTVVCTSLFHVKEVSDRLAALRPDVGVIGVYTHPDERALAEIAQIKPGSTVGIVVSNAEGGHRFAGQIAMVATVTATLLVRPTDQQIRALADALDVIVCSRSRQAQVTALALALPVITLPFHVSPLSARRVREELVDQRGMVAAD
jgi:DNA-binding transcriptional regulator YhcF (GntR family)